MPEIEIFKKGTHISASGERLAFGDQELDEICETYNPQHFRAPLIIAHQTFGVPDHKLADYSADDGQLPASKHLAFGFPEKLKRVGDAIVGVFDKISPKFTKLQRDGALLSISSSLYRPTSPTNPYPGKWALRHIAGLGAEAPAVKGMTPLSLAELPSATTGDEFAIAFSADEEGIVEFAVDPEPEYPESVTSEQMDKVAVPMLKFMIQAEDAGYKDTISDITDDEGEPPSEANGWLWDGEKFSGLFVDSRPAGDRVFQFELSPDGEDGWERSFSPISGVDEGNFSDPVIDAIEFATGKKKQCTKGYSCGATCISRARTCRSSVKGRAKTATAWMQKQVKKLKDKFTPKPQKSPTQKVQSLIAKKRIDMSPVNASESVEFGAWTWNAVGDAFRGMREWIIENWDLETADRVLPASLIGILQQESAMPEPLSWDINNLRERIARLEGANEISEGYSMQENDAQDFTEREQAIARREQEIAQREAALRKTEFTSFCEGLKGKLTPAIASTEEVVAFMEYLHEGAEVEFSDSNKQAPLNWFKTLLAKIPDQVSFGRLPGDEPRPGRFSVQAADFDEESAQLDAEIRSYMASQKSKHGRELSYSEATDEVLATHR